MQRERPPKGKGTRLKKHSSESDEENEQVDEE